MNTNFEMAYLSDADDYFGPNLGGATVYTNTRTGFVESCPNVGELLSNMTFTLEMWKPADERHHGRRGRASRSGA